MYICTPSATVCAFRRGDSCLRRNGTGGGMRQKGGGGKFRAYGAEIPAFAGMGQRGQEWDGGESGELQLAAMRGLFCRLF
ncbi:MAG: hypothetical protein ACR2QC_06850 [Gammaproteobacteria bacterium]